MKTKNILKNRVMLFSIILFAMITIQAQAEINEINASVSTMRQLKLHITQVTHYGGHYGSYGFNIKAYCTWRRVYDSYWGVWGSDASYVSITTPASYSTGTITSDSGTNNYNVYSDYCYGEYIQIVFKVWKRGIFLGFITSEGEESMGTRSYSVETTSQSISFADDNFHVTVYYNIWD